MKDAHVFGSIFGTKETPFEVKWPVKDEEIRSQPAVDLNSLPVDKKAGDSEDDEGQSRANCHYPQHLEF